MTKLSRLDLAEMDEGIKPLIILLNKKGIDTKFCCAGHPKAGIEQQPLEIQEAYLCVKNQLGKAKVPHYDIDGYIWFKRKKDRDFI
jgi:hypothetical protein